MLQHSDNAALAAWSFKASFAALLAWAAGVNIVFYLFIGLMVLDVVSGMLAAGAAGEIESSKCKVGMRGKAMQVILVATAELMFRLAQAQSSGHLPDLPIIGSFGAAMASFYCVHECVSIVENADRLNLPIPGWVRTALKRLGEIQDKK